MRPTFKMHLCHRAEFLTYFLFPYEYIFAEFGGRKVKNVIDEKMLTSMDNKNTEQDRIGQSLHTYLQQKLNMIVRDIKVHSHRAFRPSSLFTVVIDKECARSPSNVVVVSLFKLFSV
jgi:hypothetical protein